MKVLQTSRQFFVSADESLATSQISTPGVQLVRHRLLSLGPWGSQGRENALQDCGPIHRSRAGLNQSEKRPPAISPSTAANAAEGPFGPNKPWSNPTANIPRAAPAAARIVRLDPVCTVPLDQRRRIATRAAKAPTTAKVAASTKPSVPDV